MNLPRVGGGPRSGWALYTARMLAERWGVLSGEVRRIIREADIPPDTVRLGVAFYLEETAALIRRRLTAAREEHPRAAARSELGRIPGHRRNPGER